MRPSLPASRGAVLIYTLVYKLFDIYQILIVIWCVMSWVPRGLGNGGVDAFRDAVGTLVEPYLNVFRGLIPPFSGIDFSPIIGIFVLQIIERLVLSIII